MHGRTRLLVLTLALALVVPATAQAAPMPAGVYDVGLTSGTLGLGTLSVPFDVNSGTTFPVTLGTDPVSQPIGLAIPDIPIASPAGTASVTTQGAGITIVPATGSATLDATFNVSVTIDGVGTCSLTGVAVHMTTDEGSPWDPATNAFALADNSFPLPALNCSPALLGAIVGTVLGSTGGIDLLGTAIRRPDPPAPTTTTNNTTPTTTTSPTGTSSQPVTTVAPETTQQPGTTPAAKRCVVPRLVGKTLKRAKRALKKAGCRTGKVKSKVSKKKRGRVVKQRYKAGKKLRYGAKVPLVVSKGPKKTRS